MQATLGTYECNGTFSRRSKTDDQKWKSYVAPILGDTDMVIFAFGATSETGQDILQTTRNSSITRAQDMIISVM